MSQSIAANNQDYLDRQANFESNARSYPRRLPIAIRKAQGLYLTNMDGKVYMDCLCGAGTLALGHNHPVIIEAIYKHLEAGLPLHTLDLTTPVKDEFVSELFATLPSEFATHARIQFCSPSGADAVEAALKLVKTATGRRSILGFSGGWHGQTHGALALMGSLSPKEPVAGLMSDVHFIPYPYSYRCPLVQDNCVTCRCSNYVENLLNNPEGGIPHPAGMILEVVQGEGGVIPAPDDWLADIRRMTADQDIPLIFDEVQTGWGRTGKLYAFEHSGVIPDVLVLSKAIGGSLPLAVIVYHEKLDKWTPGAHSGTFRGNQLAMATGLATLRFMLQNDIPAHAAAMGERFKNHLAEMQGSYPFIGEVRAKGLMIGIEIVDPNTTDKLGRPKGNGDLVGKIQAECFARGLMIEAGGQHRSVLRLLPPLNITPEQVDDVCEILNASLRVFADTREVAHV